MAVNDENIDLGFRDLLFNSGVACMLLFIIFSIRMGKDIIEVDNQNPISNKNFKFTDARSLIVTDIIKSGKYKSIISVELEGVTKDQYTIALDRKIGNWSIADNREQYIAYNPQKNTLTYYMILGAVPTSTISLKIDAQNQLTGSYMVTAKIIDGKSVMESDGENGLMMRSWNPVSFGEEREILFRPGAIGYGQKLDELAFLLFDLR